MRKVSNILLAGILICSLSFSGCGDKEETTSVVVDSSETMFSFSQVTTEYNDVVLTKKIDCISVQSTEQEVCFDVTGKYVDKVYVHEGQTVKKGDLLCELSSSKLEEDIENLTYQIQRNELLLSYLKTDKELDIQEMIIAGYANADNVKAVSDDYERQATLLNDALEFDRLELSRKKTELSNSRLYATMDGIVYRIDKNLEGSTSKADKVIMTIIDNSAILFKVKDVENKDMFKEGDMVDMTVSFSAAAGDYILNPYNMNEWQDEMLFSVYTGPDDVTVEVGTYGTIKIITGYKEHVLSLPTNVVHQAEDKYFVYTLSPEGIREIRYIEVGLIGDERVEIVSGLSEGEKVVKK